MVLLAMVAIGLLVGAGIWIWKTAQDPRWTGLQTIRVQSDGRVGRLRAGTCSPWISTRLASALTIPSGSPRPRCRAIPVHGVRIRLRERTPGGAIA